MDSELTNIHRLDVRGFWLGFVLALFLWFLLWQNDVLIFGEIWVAFVAGVVGAIIGWSVDTQKGSPLMYIAIGIVGLILIFPTITSPAIGWLVFFGIPAQLAVGCGLVGGVGSVIIG
jgi:hypothetical protein